MIKRTWFIRSRRYILILYPVGYWGEHGRKFIASSRYRVMKGWSVRIGNTCFMSMPRRPLVNL